MPLLVKMLLTQVVLFIVGVALDNATEAGSLTELVVRRFVDVVIISFLVTVLAAIWWA